MTDLTSQLEELKERYGNVDFTVEELADDDPVLRAVDGTIKRFMEHLNPRSARVVALEKPTDYEQRQWYFQRYINHLPARGEITLFDRSWYTRAGWSG